MPLGPRQTVGVCGPVRNRHGVICEAWSKIIRKPLIKAGFFANISVLNPEELNNEKGCLAVGFAGTVIHRYLGQRLDGDPNGFRGRLPPV
jgi:hypothetical protein